MNATNTFQTGEDDVAGGAMEYDYAEVEESELADLLGSLLQGDGEIEDLCDEDVSVRSFAESGVLTRNEGLVVRVGGAEFQVTIVRSR